MSNENAQIDASSLEQSESSKEVKAKSRKKEQTETLSQEEIDYLKKGKAMQEFIAVVGFYQKWIGTYLELGQYQYEENYSNNQNDYLESYLVEYYKKNRTLFYKGENTLFNDSIQIDLKAFNKINSEAYKEEIAWRNYIDKSEKETYPDNLEVVNFFSTTNKLSISQLFKDETFLNELYDKAEDNVKQVKLEYKDLYIADLKLIIDNFKKIEALANDASKIVEMEVRLWCKFVLSRAEEFLKTIVGQGDDKLPIPTKIYIWDALFAVMDIVPSTIGKKQKFLAAMLGTTENAIKDAQSTLNTEKLETLQKRKAKAKEVLNYLKGKANSTTKAEPKGNEIIKKVEYMICSKDIK